MKKINILLNSLLLGITSACTPKEAIEITVSPEVINADYIGNGAEWDPYDEAESWGTSVSDKDWETLYKRPLITSTIWSTTSVSLVSSISLSSTSLTEAGHPPMEIMRCGKRCFSDSKEK